MKPEEKPLEALQELLKPGSKPKEKSVTVKLNPTLVLLVKQHQGDKSFRNTVELLIQYANQRLKSDRS